MWSAQIQRLRGIDVVFWALVTVTQHWKALCNYFSLAKKFLRVCNYSCRP